MDNSSMPVSVFVDWAGAGALGVCFGFGAFLGKKVWGHWSRGSTPLSSWREDEQIKLLLREVRVVCGAERAFLAQFENGSTYASDREKWRYSWTHEDSDRLTSMATWRKDISTTLVPEEMKLVEETGPSFKLCTDLVDGTFQHMCSEMGTAAVARCIINGRMRPLGFIGLEWGSPVECPPEINKLTYYAARLERIISQSSKAVKKA